MPDSTRTDVLDEIDELPTHDAATWTAIDANGAPESNTPWPGAMKAVLLDHLGVQFVNISRQEPRADLTQRVGDPLVDRHRHLNNLGFWVGGNSMTSAPVNRGATRFVHRLLRDVVTGNYIASDRDREHVRGLLTSPDRRPVIHGSCLITGLDAGDEPAELDENFRLWLIALLKEIALVTGPVIRVVSAVLAISTDTIGGPVAGLD